MPGRDLDELLARVDLEQLADQLIGTRRGRGHGARWASPVPDHPQTGATPPMSIFVDRRGRQRFTCWATGAAGTAIDLVAVTQRLDIAAAIDWLSQRDGGSSVLVLPRRPPAPPARKDASPALCAYVERCAELLWSPTGSDALRWLIETRRLDADVLRCNQVGYDPGPQSLRRAKGLPHLGKGVVIPSFAATGELLYAQTRYLDPELAAERKYDNPFRSHGTKPRLAFPKHPHRDRSSEGPLVVCEGVIDALTVTGAGHDSVALVAAGDAEAVAEQLGAMRRPLVISVDRDAAGISAATKLAEHDGCSDYMVQLSVPSDVNDLAQRTGKRFPAIFAAMLRGAHPIARSCNTSCPSL